MKRLSVGLMLVLFLLDIAYAANSYTFSVSCSIPAVPGLNVPLTEEATEETPAVVYDNGEETLLAEKTGAAGAIKTVYTR